MTDDSYHMPICIGIGIGISIDNVFSSVLGIESIGKSGIVPPLVIDVLYHTRMVHTIRVYSYGITIRVYGTDYCTIRVWCI